MIENIMLRSAATSNSANILPFFWEEINNSAASWFIVALLFFFPEYLIISQNL
jgi:hypothetical protein